MPDNNMQLIEKIQNKLSTEQLNQIENCTSGDELQALIQENDSFGLKPEELDQLISAMSAKLGKLSDADLDDVSGGYFAI